jgi:glucose 1-dehydrogenase
MGKLDRRVALVTGAARGIGKGCALCLAEEGADICVNEREHMEEANATAAEIEKMGRKARVVQGDIGVVEEVDALVTTTLAAFGRIDILISNVAYEVRMSILDAPLEEVRRTLDVSLVGAIRLAQLTAQHMVERGGGGKIIFISSIHGEIPFGNAIAYNAIKAGINHLACSMANELTPYHINVNAIAPGWIDTPGERRWTTDARLKELGPKLPWGRMGTPRDIGKATAFLASDDADYITGSILKVDGGYTASLTLRLD